MLVTSLKAYAQYQQKSAWLWEHQALDRARSIAGDANLCQQFEQIRCQILTQKRDENVVREEVLKMRQKMKDHLGSSSEQKKHGIFHLKQDAGGIVDIEFMAQYAVLAWGETNPALAHYSDNVRILEDAARAGCLSSEDATALIHAYLRERAESHRLALANQSMQVNAADWHDTREIVCKLWQRLIDPTAIALESEWCDVPQATIDLILATKTRGNKVIAVGTTATRALESAAQANQGQIAAWTGDTQIFIYPGYQFCIVDRLITNFHLPESTLLMLVSALSNRDHILAAYQHAVEQRYRFFSYGDAMLVDQLNA
jgi:hypothetical protein